MHPIDYVVSETERQSGTIREAIGMYVAWGNACRYYDISLGAVMSETAIKTWAYMINGSTAYRRVPAVFNQGMPALQHDLIPRAMGNLVKGINEPGIFNAVQVRPGISVTQFNADWFTREFLNIHPFADGNGRVGSLLWNFLNGTLHEPEPMPYFFGQDNG